LRLISKGAFSHQPASLGYKNKEVIIMEATVPTWIQPHHTLIKNKEKAVSEKNIFLNRKKQPVVFLPDSSSKPCKTSGQVSTQLSFNKITFAYIPPFRCHLLATWLFYYP